METEREGVIEKGKGLGVAAGERDGEVGDRARDGAGEGEGSPEIDRDDENRGDDEDEEQRRKPMQLHHRNVRRIENEKRND